MFRLHVFLLWEDTSLWQKLVTDTELKHGTTCTLKLIVVFDRLNGTY